MTLDPSAFTLTGGTVGVLLIHGITASPTELRLIADYLHQRGLTVSAPLLPGHGTTIRSLHNQRWQDWAKHVEASLTNLQTRCTKLFVAGVSLGSLLALYLAAYHPELVGAVVYSPMLKMPGGIAVHLLPLAARRMKNRAVQKPAEFYSDPSAAARIWSYPTTSYPALNEMARLTRTVRPLLPKITSPVLIIYSKLDRLMIPSSPQFTYDHVGSGDKTLVALDNSGHGITFDSEWQTVADKTYQFIEAHNS